MRLLNMQFVDMIQFNVKKMYLIIKKGLTPGLFFCEVFPEDLPESIFISHPVGIVIRKGTIIGERVTIHQNVTIGGKDRYDTSHCTIGNDVIIYSGVVIIGGVTIGDGAVIGAGSVITKDVDEHTLVYDKRVQLRRGVDDGRILDGLQAP